MIFKNKNASIMFDANPKNVYTLKEEFKKGKDSRKETKQKIKHLR